MSSSVPPPFDAEVPTDIRTEVGTEVRTEILDGAECRRLLGRAVVGRLAYTVGALPAIRPVSFVVHADEVLVPTRVGSSVAAASRGAVVAFEVDEFDVDRRTGWHVTVVGAARVISDPADLRALAHLGAVPWTPADHPCFVAIGLTVLHGRRLLPALSAAG